MKLRILLSLLPLVLAAPAPIIAPSAASKIPGRYIIKFKEPSSQSLMITALSLLEKDASHVYDVEGFRGFAAEMSNDILNHIRSLPGIEYVEQDTVVHSSFPLFAKLKKKAYVTENPSTWGLGRISHINSSVQSYTYDSSAGVSTCVYVIDTGIYTAHPEFEGRAAFLANFAGDGNNTDGNGHGTHVAGTIGSKTYGVAKKTNLFAVKVLDASGAGTASGVIAGINFVANDTKTRNCPKGAVANLSLGGSQSDALNQAAANTVAAGVFMAVAAGNSADDASNYSPASEPSVFTVGATDSSNNFAYFSNYGPDVKILAPGVGVLSTWNNGGTNTLSGTSMATPHVAGLGAYLLALEGKKSPAALSSRLQTLASKNETNGVPSGTPNYLAFNGNPQG